MHDIDVLHDVLRMRKLDSCSRHSDARSLERQLGIRLDVLGLLQPSEASSEASRQEAYVWQLLGHVQRLPEAFVCSIPLLRELRRWRFMLLIWLCLWHVSR